MSYFHPLGNWHIILRYKQRRGIFTKQYHMNELETILIFPRWGRHPSHWLDNNPNHSSKSSFFLLSGHGNMTPKTSEGKIVTIIYAIIGVPLMLMCLSSLGGLLAEALQCAYTRLCIATAASSSPSSLTTSTITTTTELSTNNSRLCRKKEQHQRKHKYEGCSQNEGVCVKCHSIIF